MYRTVLVPQKVLTEYGSSLAEAVPEWQPETMEQRKQMLTEESKYITYYKQTDLPGYAIIKINSRTSNVKLQYYSAYGKKPYDKISISEILRK